jgi:hypothetical protein
MALPPSIADPLFLAELALKMGMPVGKLGEEMSNWELCVFWPAYFRQLAIHDEAEAKKRESR